MILALGYRRDCTQRGLAQFGERVPNPGIQHFKSTWRLKRLERGRIVQASDLSSGAARIGMGGEKAGWISLCSLAEGREEAL
jgi:hypothetical protein